MGVVFFPSLPFMGVMLFPSFVLGNVSGAGGALLVPLSLFSILLSLPLLSSPSSSLSFSLPSLFSFFPHLILPFFLSFRTNSFHPFFLLLLFSTSFLFFSFFHLVFLSSFSLEAFFLGNGLYCVLPRCNR